ncbi:MAG: hypothetical protein GWN93_26955 [Deltaproteobacteria bacterium]|nr:hypothetical protein [Deltaproteobacteria bacterium]
MNELNSNSKTTALQEKSADAVPKPKTVKDWITTDSFKDAIKKALPSHMSTERFIRIALTAFMRTPKLADCTQQSLFQVLLDLSSLGLEPDGRRAHIVPYRNKNRGITNAQLIIDYKGLIELGKRSGEVKMWSAHIVCKNDFFSWDSGEVIHKVDFFSDRGAMVGAYSHVITRDDIHDYEVMTFDEVESIRKRSKSSDDGPWKTDFLEMAKKTVIRRHSKRLTLSPEFADALEKDFDRFDDFKPSADVDDIDIMPKAIEVESKSEPEIVSAPKADPAAPPPPPDIDPGDQISKSTTKASKKTARTKDNAGEAAICQFGKDKGTPWVDMPYSKLEWYCNAVDEWVNDPAKQKYRDSNEQALKAIIEAMEQKEDGDDA